MLELGVGGGEVVMGSLICWEGLERKEKNCDVGRKGRGYLSGCGRDAVGKGSVAQSGSARKVVMIVKAALQILGTL